MRSTSRLAAQSQEAVANDSLDEIDVHIGRRLRRRRRLLGLTLQEIGDRCGVGLQQIQKYECGSRMTAVRLWQVAEILETPIGYFYEGLPSGQREGAQAAKASRGLNDVAALDPDCLETEDLIQACSGLDLQAQRCLLTLALTMREEVEA